MLRRFCSLVLLLASPLLLAQTPGLRIDKIDPPGWWAGFPAPMLLLHGEGLHDAHFRISDPQLHILRTQPADNGHWAILWLDHSPTKPETVTLSADHAGAHITADYHFAQRREANTGFAGINTRDVLYLIMQDRFADGDPGNDGLLANHNATSDDAHAERKKPRGWHGGDLRGVQSHLDYLQQLGVSAIWLTPVYENHRFESYHGYHATDMYKVDEHYGTLADLQALSADLHRRGMKLILDQVPNHVGPDHPWVKDPPLPDWFHGTLEHHIAA